MTAQCHGARTFSGYACNADLLTGVSGLQEWLDCRQRAWRVNDKFNTILAILHILQSVHGAGMAVCDLSTAGIAW